MAHKASMMSQIERTPGVNMRHLACNVRRMRILVRQLRVRTPFLALPLRQRSPPMPFIPGPTFPSAFARSQLELGMSQGDLGKLLGVSRRTISRWVGSFPGVTEPQVHTLVRAVHPRNPVLAAELAAHVGQTLVGLGVVAPPAPPAPAPPPPPPPRPLPPIPLLVESVVCAAADALETKPAAVRDALTAAFVRAQKMGLSVEEVVRALSPRPETPAPAANDPKSARVKGGAKTA
jgi:hypothetical protein